MKRECDDDDSILKKLLKPRRVDPKICNVKCEWENCQYSIFIAPSDYNVFSDHLRAHADDFVCSLKMEAAREGNETAISCCCMWRECSWEGCSDLMDLIRHIMFHGYHALLKGLAELVLSQLNIAPCRIDVDYPYHSLAYVTSPYVCFWGNCKSEFICPGKFYEHVQDHVNKVAEGVNVKMMRICCQWFTESKLCGQDFRDKHKLKEHLRTHTHEKLLACPGCGALFSNRTKFLDHLSRQNEAAYENYQCSHCLKRYASERLLRDHMRHHINYLKCPHCDMTCPNAGSLKYHILYRHNEERPFSCCVCKLTFKAISDLNRHEETHLEKNYLCNAPGCTFATKTSRSLQTHIQLKHSEKTSKPYGCHICNNVYSRGFSLTKHLKAKHNYCWPSGHPRFRYIEHEDGLYRLQMVRFQSVELTERLQQDNAVEQQGVDYEVEVESNDNVIVETQIKDLSVLAEIASNECSELKYEET